MPSTATTSIPGAMFTDEITVTIHDDGSVTARCSAHDWTLTADDTAGADLRTLTRQAIACHRDRSH